MTPAGFWIPWICTSKITLCLGVRLPISVLEPLQIQLQSVPIKLLSSKRTYAIPHVLLLQTLCNSLYPTDNTGMGDIICNEDALAKYWNIREAEKISLLIFSPIVSQCQISFCHMTLFSTIMHKRSNILQWLVYSLETVSICKVKGPIP